MLLLLRVEVGHRHHHPAPETHRTAVAERPYVILYVIPNLWHGSETERQCRYNSLGVLDLELEVLLRPANRIELALHLGVHSLEYRLNSLVV